MGRSLAAAAERLVGTIEMNLRSSRQASVWEEPVGRPAGTRSTAAPVPALTKVLVPYSARHMVDFEGGSGTASEEGRQQSSDRSDTVPNREWPDRMAYRKSEVLVGVRTVAAAGGIPVRAPAEGRVVEDRPGGGKTAGGFDPLG